MHPIYSSADGGINWIEGQIDTNSGDSISAINDIHFEDEQTGWLCSNSSVYYSEDGGLNWNFMATLADSTLSRICFFDNEGWVMGDKIIYYSSDGKFVSISFVNNSAGWILTKNGNIYRYGI